MSDKEKQLDFVQCIRDHAEGLCDRGLVNFWADLYHHRLKNLPADAHPRIRKLTLQTISELLAERFIPKYHEIAPDANEFRICALMIVLAVELVEGDTEFVNDAVETAKFKGASLVSEERFLEVWEACKPNVSKTTRELEYKKRDSVYQWLKILDIERD